MEQATAQETFWSQSLTAWHSDETNRKTRLPGDKILLPQSALDDLLAAASRQATHHIRHDLSYNVEYPSSGSHLPNPLTFLISNAATGKSVYAGVQEFSADEGEAVLSRQTLRALQIGDGQQAALDVRLKTLPRGTFVRLRPLAAGYDADDWKALLERQLRGTFTTLTKDSQITLSGPKGEAFDFLVDELRPDGADGVCIVDTDLEVDIEALDEEQARETLRKIASRSARQRTPADIDIWKPVGNKFTVVAGEAPQHQQDYYLSSWDRSRPLVVSLDHRGDAPLSLFVSPKDARQREPPGEDVHVYGHYSITQNATEVIQLPQDISSAEGIMITVQLPSEWHTEGIGVKYTLKAGSEPAPQSGERLADQVGSEALTDEKGGADEERCRNCRMWVPKRTIFLHEGFCRRNNVVCNKCGSVFQKNSQEWTSHWHCDYDESFGNSSLARQSHDRTHHTSLTCPSELCAQRLPSLADLAHHRTTVCPGKPILCRFCHLEVPQEGDPSIGEELLTGLATHELSCGTRTEDCFRCGKLVRLREMAAHQANHELDRAKALPPPLCRNELCGRLAAANYVPRGSSGAQQDVSSLDANPLGLCSLCFAPLFTQQHDPEGKALRRRVERKYLSQVMKGCGRGWCRNQWCATGRSRSESGGPGLGPAVGGSMREALQAVKPLMEELGASGEGRLWFCVEQASHEWRAAAEKIANEGQWDLRWCIAAVHSSKGDAVQARDWLSKWAPMRR